MPSPGTLLASGVPHPRTNAFGWKPSPRLRFKRGSHSLTFQSGEDAGEIPDEATAAKSTWDCPGRGEHPVKDQSRAEQVLDVLPALDLPPLVAFAATAAEVA